MVQLGSDEVHRAYHLFLGRDPESERSRDSKLGIEIPELLKEFIGSAEFLTRIRDCILSLKEPSGGLFDAPPGPDLCVWTAHRMPLAEATRLQVAAASSWMELYHLVFSDRAFRAAISPLAALRSPFLDHLDALRGMRTADADGTQLPSEPRWVLVTGAPCSGTSVLRAMLAQHPNVVLLQEYGLTALVDRVENIVNRPAHQLVEWDDRGDSGKFGEIADFYRKHPARTMDARDDGQLDMRHFGRIAFAILSALAPEKSLQVVGDKMPMSGSWEDVPRLFSRLLGLRLLIVIRNPAEVIRSSFNRRAASERGRDVWPIQTVQEAVAQWVRAWQRTRTLKAKYPDAVHVLKYEDLCAGTTQAIGRIDEFLGLCRHEPDIRIEVRPPDLSLITPAEGNVLFRLLGPVIASWPRATPDALMQTWSRLPIPIVFGRWLHLTDEEQGAYLVDGFSVAAPRGRWTDGALARIELPHGETTGLLLVELRVSQAAVGGDGVCDVVMRAVGGGAAAKLFTFRSQGGRAAFVSRAADSRQLGELAIELIVATPRIAVEDGRLRGICVEAIRVTHLHRPDTTPYDGVRSEDRRRDA